MKTYYQDKDVTVYNGDVLALLPQLPDESVDCCITSPPYWGLRDYKADGQLGLEKTPEEYVAKIVLVFREVRRILKKEGTCWLNLGDSYWGGGFGTSPGGNEDFNSRYPKQASNKGTADHETRLRLGSLKKGDLLKPKDLIGIPWRCAFALQADGWWLRQDIIWSKPNPMPESVTDRCTKSHEYIFLLSKSAHYYYDAEAIKEEANYDGRNDTVMKGSDKYADGFVPNQAPQTFHQRGHERWNWQDGIAYRNKRSVWEITTKPYKEAHFATFPPDLVQPMVMAGCPLNGLVLDPFAGSGTTLQVAKHLNRRAIGIEIKAEYCDLIIDRCRQQVMNLEVK